MPDDESQMGSHERNENGIESVEAVEYVPRNKVRDEESG
jgi:hypothetical protein